jgi:hypothetical protein
MYLAIIYILYIYIMAKTIKKTKTKTKTKTKIKTKYRKRQKTKYRKKRRVKSKKSKMIGSGPPPWWKRVWHPEYTANAMAIARSRARSRARARAFGRVSMEANELVPPQTAPAGIPPPPPPPPPLFSSLTPAQALAAAMAAGQERRGFSFGNPNASDRSARDSAHQIERRGDLDLWELDPVELASAAEGLELPGDRVIEQQILSPRILNTRARQYRFWPEKIS